MKRAIIDLSSVLWTCLQAGKDKEFGREYPSEGGKTVFVNSAGYGHENAMAHLAIVMDELKVTPRQMLFVVEGKNSKAGRQALHPLYKAGRDKVPQMYDSFNGCKASILDAFCNAGAQAVWQDGGVEADDVLGYLARNLQGERWIVSGDKDLAQVIDGFSDIHHWRAGVIDRNPFGDFPHRLIPVCIALVGDSSDKIPGARGFGDAKFQDLHTIFGDEGLVALEGLIKNKRLLDLQEDVGEYKHLQKVIDDADNVYMSHELGRLHLEKVNTLRRPLTWRAGMVKPRRECKDEPLRKHCGESRIVSAENYAGALEFFKKHAVTSPEFSLDIETSTPEESDAWLERLGKSEDRTPVDVFGSELTGMGITFGANMQFTFYLTHDHVEEPGVSNLTKAQVANLVNQIPRDKVTWVHNAAFELPICFMEWGQDWIDDPEWHGMLRNVRDTRIASNYVDENQSAGLKALSKRLLDYDQQTYQEVTTEVYPEGEWYGVGKLLRKFESEDFINAETGSVELPAEGWVEVQHKMNELTARKVFGYGADDPICTAALANHFRTIMEIENTWKVFEEVETLPAYVQALAFVDGIDFSLENMRAMEKDDDETYDRAKVTLDDYLMKIGFDGTRFVPLETLDAAGIKRACLEITGCELKTMVRTPSKLAKLIEQTAGEEGSLLAALVDKGALPEINELMEAKFEGTPQLDLGSSRQMTALLYDHMRLPVHIINDVTPLQREKNPALADAVKKFKARRSGHDVTLNANDVALLRQKAKADDTAIEFALAFDADHMDDEARAVLKVIGELKTVTTRRSLFYKNYWGAKHWKDGKIHPQIKQCGTVTRRPTGSNPNVYQLPKKGDGVKFRSNFLPHTTDGVVVSIDFNGQELRLAAERSQDKNLLACYVGDNLKDVHSTTAADAMKLKWGAQAVKGLFAEHGQDLDMTVDGEYELFQNRLRKLPKGHPTQKQADDLRRDSKGVNFTAQFRGQAPKIAERLIMSVEDAQLYLDARSAMFPDVDRAADRAEAYCKRTGIALTMLGGRRHLQHAILSDDKWEASRAARQAWNMEIQGSAAEMTKLAMARLWKSGALHRLDMRFFASIYDELVFTVHRLDAVEATRIVHDCMIQKYADMAVPIVGSISIGLNFADQIECGDEFNEASIKAALNDIFAQKEVA